MPLVLLLAVIAISILVWKPGGITPMVSSSSQAATAVATQAQTTTGQATGLANIPAGTHTAVTETIDSSSAPAAGATQVPAWQPTSTAVATRQAAQPQLPLAGRKIGLDPGHGPREDMGAVLTNSSTGKLILSEAEFNLDVALRCRDILVARGADVMLTRETADTFTAPWPADANGDGIVGASGDDLQERIDILNNFHADAFISIHANGGSLDASREDVQVLYCGTSDCTYPDQNRQLGAFVRDELVSKLTDAGYAPQGALLQTDLEGDSSTPPLHLFMLGPVSPPRHVRAVTMPGVLGESLYVTSSAQAAELNKSSIRQAVALAYADALQEYFAAK